MQAQSAPQAWSMLHETPATPPFQEEGARFPPPGRGRVRGGARVSGDMVEQGIRGALLHACVTALPCKAMRPPPACGTAQPCKPVCALQGGGECFNTRLCHLLPENSVVPCPVNNFIFNLFAGQTLADDFFYHFRKTLRIERLYQPSIRTSGFAFCFHFVARLRG